MGAAFLVAGCGGGDDSGSKTGASKPGAVDVFDFGFKPSEITVNAGTTVKWTNTGKQIHNVKQLPGSNEKFFSKALEAGASFSHRFERPGDYPYFCNLHPTLMRGQIVVR